MPTNKTPQMPKLCKCHINENSPSKTRWYPNSMPIYEEFLNKYIDNSYKDLRKNIAYNMQYLEYLHQTNIELSLSSVITTQNYKSFIIFSVSIIECVLYYSMVKNNLLKAQDWKELRRTTNNIDKDTKYTLIFEKKIKEENIVKIKLDSMIKKAKANAILGQDDPLYEELHDLQRLRNTTHMYNPKNQGTDWYIFKKSQYNLARSALFKIFKTLFKPNYEQEKIIYFLKNDQPIRNN